MPNLCTLNLTVGWEIFNPEVITAISRGPQIRTLVLGYHHHNMESPASQMFINETNPWPHLESVTIQHTDRSGLFYVPEGYAPPKLRLTQVAINYQSGGLFAELPWLTHYSKETLTHISLVCGAYDSSSSCLGNPNIKNIQSLTLGHTLWNDELLHTLHTFNNLKELRFVSFIRLQRPFPSHLPDTIEHLLVTAPFLPVEGPQGQSWAAPDMVRPALLKRFTAIIVGRSVYTHESRLYTIGKLWAKAYAQYCQYHGIMNEIRQTDSRGGYIRGSRTNFSSCY
jgi:hypothetical protein